MCPHSTVCVLIPMCVLIPICVSSYLHVCPHTTFSSELNKKFACMFPHSTICVSSYYYICVSYSNICVLILYMWPHTTTRVLILLSVSERTTFKRGASASCKQ